MSRCARLRGRCGRGGGIGFPLFPGAFAEKAEEKGFGVLEGYGEVGFDARTAAEELVDPKPFS